MAFHMLLTNIAALTKTGVRSSKTIIRMLFVWVTGIILGIIPTPFCAQANRSPKIVNLTDQTQSSALGFIPVLPCRIVDTRNPNGPFGGPFLGAGTTRGFTIPNSACGIPATAQAYSLNVTVVPKGKLAFLTMFPCGQNLPLASTLNSDGRVKAAAAIVPAGTNGGACAFTTAIRIQRR